MAGNEQSFSCHWSSTGGGEDGRGLPGTYLVSSESESVAVHMNDEQF